MSRNLNVTPTSVPAAAGESRPAGPATTAGPDNRDRGLLPPETPGGPGPLLLLPSIALGPAVGPIPPPTAATADIILSQPLMAFGPGGRRTRVTQACESCRKRKVKCSGPPQGPGLQTCRHCLEYRLECVWATDLKNRVAPGGGGSKAKAASASASASKRAKSASAQSLVQEVGGNNNDGEVTAAAAATKPRPKSSSKPARSTSKHDKRQRQPDPADDSMDGSASDLTSSSAAGASSLADTIMSEPSKSRRLDAHSSIAAPAPSALSTLSTVRVATDHDVQELANHLTLVVSLDETGRMRGMSNYGTSTGLAALKDWSPTVAQGLFSVTPFTEPSLPPSALLRENQLLPSRLAATTFINVFFDSAGKWLTFASRRHALAQLDLPTPHHAFLYAVMAFGAFKLEMGYGLTVLNSPMLLSRVFSERAKRLLAPTMSSHVQTIESVQALMLLSCYSLNTPGTSAWGMSGLAIRMAFDMGLHLDFRAAPFREKVAPALIPMYAKTFAFMYAFDRHISVTLGRPMMLNEEECYLNLNELMKTPENLDRYPPDVHDELVAPDEYFLWSIRLADLSGKLIRTLNCIQYHRQLPFTLHELHQMLSQYRLEVPQRLHFRANEHDLTLKTQTAALNLRFYGLIIAMYRPLITSRSAQVNTHLKQQYLSLMESALTASLEIVVNVKPHHTIYPYPQFNDVLNMINVCVLLLTSAAPADPVTTAALTGNVLGYLDTIHDLILHTAPSWPIMAQLAPVVHDIKCKLLNTSPTDLEQVKHHVAWIISRYNQTADAVMHLLEQPAADQIADVGVRVTEYLRLHQGHLALAHGVSEVAMSQQKRQAEDEVRAAAQQAARAAQAFVEQQLQQAAAAAGGLLGLEAMLHPHPQAADALMAEVFGSSASPAAAAAAATHAYVSDFSVSLSASPPAPNAFASAFQSLVPSTVDTSSGAAGGAQRDQSPFFINGVFDVFGSAAKSSLPPVPANVFAADAQPDLVASSALADMWNPLAVASGQYRPLATGPVGLAGQVGGAGYSQVPMGGYYPPPPAEAAPMASALLLHSSYGAPASVGGVGMWPNGSQVPGTSQQQQGQQMGMGGIVPGFGMDPMLWASGDGLS